MSYGPLNFSYIVGLKTFLVNTISQQPLVRIQYNFTIMIDTKPSCAYCRGVALELFLNELWPLEFLILMYIVRHQLGVFITFSDISCLFSLCAQTDAGTCMLSSYFIIMVMFLACILKFLFCFAQNVFKLQLTVQNISITNIKMVNNCSREYWL